VKSQPWVLVSMISLVVASAAWAGPAKDRPAPPGKSPAQEKGVRSEYPEIDALLEQRNYPEALAAASAASAARAAWSADIFATPLPTGPLAVARGVAPPVPVPLVPVVPQATTDSASSAAPAARRQAEHFISSPS
jgi:hypothetical protein